MVSLTKLLCKIKKDELGKHLGLQFIDKLRVFVQSGQGGNGLTKMGGVGGDGGSIILRAHANTTLKAVYAANLLKRYKAGNGETSKKLKLNGDNGENVVIEVPCGVTAVTDSGVLIGEVNNEGDEAVVCRGGHGGSPLNKYRGQSGHSYSLNLDLKLIADIGLIGFPNAGKSTLLSLVSRAQPKIASYPFTTINPQLGIIEYDDSRTITMADLPGLIEGAHYNRGMGHKFLKHVSRTKLHMFVVDINGFQLNPTFESRSAFETVVYLNKELEMYDHTLVRKPSILVLNKECLIKMDTQNANEKLAEFQEHYANYDESLKKIDEFWRPAQPVKFEQIVEISAKDNQNVDELCMVLRDMIDEAADSSAHASAGSNKNLNKIKE